MTVLLGTRPSKVEKKNRMDRHVNVFWLAKAVAQSFLPKVNKIHKYRYSARNLSNGLTSSEVDINFNFAR